MSETLTEHQERRIRTADAEDIAKMIDQDRYWNVSCLQTILKRIEKLNNEDVSEAIDASRHSLEILRQLRDPSADLQALTLSVHASTLRYAQRPDEALAIYEKALALEGLSNTGRGDVLSRMAVTLVCLGKVNDGLEAINTALALVSDSASALAVRGWALMVSGNHIEAFEDCMRVIEDVHNQQRTDYTLLSAIVNSCTILSYRVGLDVDASTYLRMESTIEIYRKTLPRSGSAYYKTRRPRLMLSRAQALLMMRTDRIEQAVPILKRTAQGMREQYPDVALATTLDLMCALAETGEQQQAGQEASGIIDLLDRVSFSISPLARNALTLVALKQSVDLGEAIELRMLLRPAQSIGSS